MPTSLAPRLLRSPFDASTGFPPLVSLVYLVQSNLTIWTISNRFFRTDTFIEHTSAWRLAYVCWMVNSLERWLGLAVTDFRPRDRIDQQPWSLVTNDVPTTALGTLASYTEVTQAIRDRLYNTGGPSAQGAYRYYIHELLSQARAALAVVIDAMWESPPAGPGRHGAIYGSRWSGSYMDAGGNPVPFVVQPTAGGGYPTTPDALNEIDDSTDWPFNTGAAQPFPRDHYLPIDNLKPDGDWNTGFFEALKFRIGTVPNANHWPSDFQLLADFSLRPHEISFFTFGRVYRIVTFANGSTTVFADSTVEPPAAAGMASGTRRVPWPIRAFFSEGVIPNDWSPATYWGYSSTSTRHRLGFYQPVLGSQIWKLTMWDWMVYSYGWVPTQLRARGKITMRLTVGNSEFHPGLISSASYSISFKIGGTILGTVADSKQSFFGSFGVFFEQTLEFDVDVSAELQGANFVEITVASFSSSGLGRQLVSNVEHFWGLTGGCDCEFVPV